MKKLLSVLLVVVMLVMSLTACSNSKENESENKDKDQTVESEDSSEKKTVGFVTFGLSGDFFQMLADTYVSTMEAAGWEAEYVDGKCDPTTQISAAENYIAKGVDVLVIWSVAPEAMNAVIESAMDAGIKVVAFVAPTEKYDALMLSDDAKLADNCAKMAAKWIDETYADAEDHSVPVAVFSYRNAKNCALQADELDKIEEFSTKAKFIKEVECDGEDADTGMAKAENLYTTNPEIKVFLTAHNGIATGINNYFTSMSSPVTDYSDMAIFAINGDKAMAETIKSSINNEAPLRGTVMTGSVQDTANEIKDVILGLTDGSIESGHIQYAATIFVYDDTVDEYLSTGTVKSVTEEDFN